MKFKSTKREKGKKMLELDYLFPVGFQTLFHSTVSLQIWRKVVWRKVVQISQKKPQRMRAQIRLIKSSIKIKRMKQLVYSIL